MRPLSLLPVLTLAHAVRGNGRQVSAPEPDALAGGLAARGFADSIWSKIKSGGGCAACEVRPPPLADVDGIDF